MNVEQIVSEEFSTKDEILNGKEIVFHYWETMKYFIGLIRASELKAGLILSFYGIIFNFVYQNISHVTETFDKMIFLYIFPIIWLTLTIISIYFSVRCFIPKFETKYEPNIFFFGDVISKFGDIKEYSKTFLENTLDKERIYEQLGQQIYINAKITALKFTYVNKSIRFLVYSLIFLMLTIIVEILSLVINN